MFLAEVATAETAVSNDALSEFLAVLEAAARLARSHVGWFRYEEEVGGE